jgi:hypothetical protein
MSDRVLGARGLAIVDLLDDDVHDALSDLLGSLSSALPVSVRRSCRG